MKKLILVTAIVAALSFPVGAFGATFTGVVVGKTGSSLAVVSKSGTVRTVQARSHARVGARVRVNGAAVRVLGLTHRARIHAIVRRSKGHAQSVIQTGGLKVNLDTKTVDVNGQRVHLTGKEYQMLELLSLRKGTTLTKEMFLNHLYGGMDEPELKIIDVFICKLRKKLAAATGGKHYIETVWGRGYVLRNPEDESEAA